MSRIITKIELDGKIIGSKPLSSNDTVSSIRDKIKEKTKGINYKFLDNDGNDIEASDENDYTLQDIINEKKIKIVSIEGEDSAQIKIYLNNELKFSKNISSNSYLNEVRKILENDLPKNFVFLDQDECEIEKQDEKDYSVQDILNDESIKLKCDKPIAKKEKKAPKSKIEKNDSTEDKPEPTPAPPAKIKYDLSKYQELKLDDYDSGDLKLYKYSNIKDVTPKDQDRVHEYFFDKFDVNDENDAYVVLFCGKSGDGKSTAINAFFNIVKGIKMEDNFRFILITEPNTKEQNKSQTKGVHLYYIKDYNNKPIIIIDSQGYGDTDGIQEDEKTTEAFTYVFTEKINHINAACFISQSITNRLDDRTKYIISSVTGLFADDISENFIILATFANSETMKKGPAFIKSIDHDAGFLKIKKRMDKNYWFAFDSKCLFDYDINSKLAKYSYQQLCNLYEEKIKKLFPKDTKRSGDVLKNKNELKIQVNKLRRTFKDLLVKQDNLKLKEKAINEVNIKIREIEYKIRSIEEKKETLKPDEYERELRKLNQELNKNINELSHKKRIEKKKDLQADSNNLYTRCEECKENCHNPCDCWFSQASRCKIFYWISQNCEKCGHSKRVHKQEYFHYVYIEVEVQENTKDQQNTLKDELSEKERKINERINQQNNEKNSLQRQINELKYNKEDLQEEKNKNIEEKNKIQAEVNKINGTMQAIIIKLQALSEMIQLFSMNPEYIKNQNEYIDSLESQMKEIGYKKNEINSKLKSFKDRNNAIQLAKKIPKDEILSSSATDLLEKYELAKLMND